MATTYQIVRNKLEEKLLTLAAIQEVARYPKREFSGYPSVVLVPAAGESEWETNNEHQRVYAFDLQIFESTKGLGNDVALDRLYNVVDLILDEFAEDTQLEQPTIISLPAKKTMITANPVSAGWEALEDTELLLAKISIKVTISVDVT
jgi:hypothetical protein